jgi:hypothetical protein
MQKKELLTDITFDPYWFSLDYTFKQVGGKDGAWLLKDWAILLALWKAHWINWATVSCTDKLSTLA